MERLTIDEIIEHCGRKTGMYEKACDVKYLETAVMGNGIKEYWEHKQVAEYLRKLKEYEDLEEQGRLFKLPCMDKFLESVSNQDFDGRISKVVEMLERKQLFGTISLIKDLKYYLDLAIEEKAHTCKCQHNSNSIDNEHCCGCDSKQTNADRIRNMSDEELANTLFNSCLEVMHIGECPNVDYVGMCKKCILDWLQSEAE